MNGEAIKPHQLVVCSKNQQFATVDPADGQRAIELTKEASGQHHFFPLSWVTGVDDQVHVDRPGDQTLREWSTALPS